MWSRTCSLSAPVAEPGGPDSAARVSLAATIGYLAFLAGPPSLGLVGEDFGLRNSLIIPLVAVLAAIAAAPALRGPGAEREVEARGA